MHYGAAGNWGQKWPTLTNDFYMDHDPNKYKHGKQILEKCGKKSRKPFRGVCAGQAWSQKNPLAKRILVYKRDILSKDPQRAKTKWFKV